MSPLAALLIVAAATVAVPPPSAPEGGSGVQLASAQTRATIVEAAVVRQASGLQQGRDSPAPQIRRRGQTILVEFQ